MNKEIEEFKSYLKTLDFAAETIKRNSKMLIYFLEWKTKQQLEKIAYTDLLAYIRYLQKMGKSKLRINKYLLAVRHYLDLKVKQKEISTNPATGLQVKANQTKIIKGIISKKEQEIIWEAYQGKHQLLLSFVLNQSLTIKEIERIEKQHINLEKGTIYIASGRKHNSRTLKLAATQIILILKQLEQNNTYLFHKSQHNNAYYLGIEIQQINEKIRNLRQLRASVIAHWLTQENMREVQYKIGHKHIMSVEKYKQQDLETLKEQLNNCHPLK